MSVYVQSNDHIDLLVSLAVKVEAYIYKTDPASRAGRSVGLSTSRQNLNETITPTDLGRMLLAENVASVRGMYSSVDDTPEGIEYDLAVSQYNFRSVILDDDQFGDVPWALAGLKAIRGYICQSDEHDGWETSDAKVWMDTLTVRLFDHIPGYDDADTWSYERPTVRR